MTTLILDGNSIANRAYYGIRPLSNKNGIFTHSVTGFFNIYLKLLSVHNPDGAAAAFDLRAPTFRKQIYDGYKAGRKGMPDDLQMQMPYIKEILSAMGIAVLEREGFEADDILGTIAAAANSESSGLGGEKVILATGDRDSFQLITDNVSVNLLKTGGDIICTPEYIRETYGISPEQMLELKALMGDSSDNIPGVPGIGEKTALGLIKEYGGIDYIYSNIDSVTVTDSVRKKLIAGKDSAYMSRELGKICTSAPVSADLREYLLSEEKKDEERLSEILSELEMHALLKRLKLPESKAVFVKKQNAEPVVTAPDNFRWDLAAYVLDPAAAEYSAGRLFDEYGADSENELSDILYTRLKSDSGLLYIYEKIELPLSAILRDMEKTGVELDSGGLRRFGERLESDIASLEGEIFALAGGWFNIGSPKQLGVVLFDNLGLPCRKKTKTGYSTNAEVLEELADRHAIIPLILEHRSLTKLNSTYVRGLLEKVEADGRIHTTFRQTETRTGRISSVEPNIQNIPVRTERGRILRSFFTAKTGTVLLDADYSQIELRVLAHISRDEAMCESFRSGGDIHTLTASQVFNQPPEWVTPEMRRAAKAVNFGIVYGIGAFSLAKDIGVSYAEADSYKRKYLEKYSGVKRYMDETTETAKRLGYVTTMFGRRRYIPEINGANKTAAAGAARIAMNTPIQGTAADIIKIAMINVSARLAEFPGARLILQVHDELLIEAETAVAANVAEMLRAEMESAVKLDVPLIADVKTGGTWFDTH